MYSFFNIIKSSSDVTRHIANTRFGMIFVERELTTDTPCVAFLRTRTLKYANGTIK